jgi:hypothetical protein
MIFHWEYYLNKYQDLRKNGLKSPEDAYQHWLNYGKSELRIYIDIPIIFDWKNYLLYNKDLKNLINEEEAWRHFLYFGLKENRMIRFKNRLKVYCL